MELDILPAPFNVLQTFVILPYIATGRQQSNSCRQVKRAVGYAVFWLTLGPIAVAAGVILLVASLLHIVSTLIKIRKRDRNTSLANGCFDFLSIYLGGPLYLIVMWVKEPFLWVIRVFEFLSKESTPTIDQQILDVDVQEMLKDTGVSASDLRKYLENPMIDPDVRRDEVDRTTTVEHVKLLRDHLKEETQIRFETLHATVKTLSADGERNISELRDEIMRSLHLLIAKSPSFAMRWTRSSQRL